MTLAQVFAFTKARATINTYMILKKILCLLVYISLTAIIYSYIVSDGTMNLKACELFGCTFTSMWDSLKVGRYDILPSCIGFEGFVRDGKTYTYFGTFPALFRGFIEIFFRRGNTDWSRISIIVSAIISCLFLILSYIKVIGELRLNQFVEKFYIFLFGITISFGSPIMLLLSRAYIYHESIMWGLAWVSCFVYFFVRFIKSHELNPFHFFCMSVACGFALLSRIISAIGPALTLAVVLIFIFIKSIFYTAKFTRFLTTWFHWSRNKINNKELLIILLCGLVPFLLCFTFVLKVNYGKWGNPFTTFPIQYYLSRPKEIKPHEGLIELHRLPAAFFYYFIPNKTQISTRFPFVDISIYDYKHIPIVKDYKGWREPGNSYPVHSPYLFLTSIIGLVYLVQAYTRFGLILVISILVNALIVMSHPALTLRYAADILPFIAVCSIASVYTLNKVNNLNIKNHLNDMMASLLITLLGIYCAVSTMLQMKIFTHLL